MNKIMNQFHLILIYTAVFLLMAPCATAQDGQTNKYGLRVINNAAELRKSIGNDSSKMMVNLKKSIPGLVIDLPGVAIDLTIVDTHNGQEMDMGDRL